MDTTDRRRLAEELLAAETRFYAALARYHATGADEDRRGWIEAKARLEEAERAVERALGTMGTGVTTC